MYSNLWDVSNDFYLVLELQPTFKNLLPQGIFKRMCGGFSCSRNKQHIERLKGIEPVKREGTLGLTE
jgi:hypothetical protein